MIAPIFTGALSLCAGVAGEVISVNVAVTVAVEVGVLSSLSQVASIGTIRTSARKREIARYNNLLVLDIVHLLLRIKFLEGYAIDTSKSY